MAFSRVLLMLASLLLNLTQPMLVMSAGSAGSSPLAQTITNQDKQLEADRLLQQGTQQDRISQFEAAFQSWQQALKLYRDIKDRPGEGSVLGNLGNVSRNLGNYQKAIEFQEQSLAIAREFRDRLGEGASLSSLGNVYYSLGNYQKAIDFHQQSLTIKREIKDRIGEGQSLGNLGLAYYFLGNYPKAIDFHQQSLAIAHEIRNRHGEGSALGNLGLVYRSLGDYPKAIESYERSLVITREIKDRIGTGNALGNLGTVFFLIGDYPKAIKFHKKSLAIAREIKDRVGEGNSLSSLGNTYSLIGSYSKAIEFQQQHLVIAREIKDRIGEGNSLGNLGSIYGSLGNYPKAIEFHQQHLAITRELKDLEGEGLVLSNIGLTLVRQKQPELAVAFYKQSVNIRESIRQDNRKLSREEQQSYTQTVADNYRNLASLLLQQDRVMEALQVLDLLKVQELKDFFKDVKGNQRTAQGLEMLDEERQILNPLNSGLTLNLNRYLESPIVATLVQQLTKTAPKQNLKLAAYTDLQTRLQNLGTDSALLYPLVLPDRIELVLFTQNAPPVHRKVEVNQIELEQTIKSFRSAIQRPNAPDIKQPANQLYSWLIKPLEADLKQANIKTLIYAPDGQMRYIPLAALYDGQHWLVEKYQINYITALSLTKFDQLSFQPPRILAGAFTDPGAIVNLSGQTFSFTAIPFAKPEVENLAKQFPNTTQFWAGTLATLP